MTKTRSIVEAREGVMNSIFKFVANTIRTSHSPYLCDFHLIAEAINDQCHGHITIAGVNKALAEFSTFKINSLVQTK